MTGTKNSGGEWVRRFHPAAAGGTRLAAFPHAGGSASYWYPLSEALAPAVETLAIQYPGRQDRRHEEPLRSLPELADRAFEALPECADRPLVLFGHSLGSVLAFEVARRLQDAGRTPAHLFASGYPAPSRLRGGDVHRRGDEGIVEELRTVGGTDPVWLENAEFMESVLPALRADYTAIETHARGDAVLDCPLTVLTGDDDPHTTVDEAKAWGEHTAAAFDLRVFPGGHFYLDRHLPEITGLIADTAEGITG
ncbi:alpha/beta fold hydrolase [Kitasatospora sp. NBC_01560]|uniref:thioesterase II family protein n=1 Tax=Kitasatospora sp. NBC_01560 TaxID=2975965 RepID=UPI00386F3F1F